MPSTSNNFSDYVLLIYLMLLSPVHISVVKPPYRQGWTTYSFVDSPVTAYLLQKKSLNNPFFLQIVLNNCFSSFVLLIHYTYHILVYFFLSYIFLNQYTFHLLVLLFHNKILPFSFFHFVRKRT